jgi:hypothetical protein
LHYLSCKGGTGIVGQAMVLASLVSEFGLQEKIVAGGYAFAIGSAQCFSDCGFEVMFALIGGIDGAEAGAQGEFGQRGRAILFPGGAVEKCGKSWHRIIVPREVCWAGVCGPFETLPRGLHYFAAFCECKS